MSPFLEAQFKRIDAYVNCSTRPARQLLAQRGYRPPAPSAVDNLYLRGRLWELLFAMAGLRQFVRDTELLSDRELYLWLYQKWLPSEIDDLPPGASVNTEIDVSEGEDDPEAVEGPSDLLDESVPARPRFARDQWLPLPPETRWPLKVSVAAGGEEPPPGPTEEQLRAMPRWLDSMRRQGMVFPAPAELSGATFTAKLWELLSELDRRGQWVLHTDHLSDAELYARLWSADLRGPAEPPVARPKLGFRFDLLEGEGEAGRALWLRFYASVAEWMEYARNHPNHQLPPRETPPFQRDWRLPWCPPAGLF